MENYKTIDEYISSFPNATRELLAELRSCIKNRVPDATEAISYGIPTFKLNGILVHFAGYKNHIGFYPGAAGIAEFRDELSAYKVSKGTVQFPLHEPIPFNLVLKIVDFRVKQNVAKAGLKVRKVK